MNTLLDTSMNHTHELFVKKRNGNIVPVSFDKILNRIKKMCIMEYSKQLNINYTTLAMKIIDQLYDSIHTSEIDELTAEQCASMITIHSDYGILASRILISNHHKNTDPDFFNVVEKLYNFKDINDKHYPIVSKELYDVVTKYRREIQSNLNFDRDYSYDYFGFKTLERAYLMKFNGTIVERPQHLLMRVAIGIHKYDIHNVIYSYNLMSKKYFTHATPTLFNAGTPRPQLSSCYLLSMESDSIDGIYNTLGECASISKWAGGIGLHIHNIRAKGSHIRGTNGTSNGIVPMLRVFNNTARYVDQGGGRRNGSFAMYLEPWHGDIIDFLEMKKNHGDEEIKARDLFYALWIPDLFMKRVKNNEKWTLMCPDSCTGLSDVYGDDFENLYCKYENDNKGLKTIDARDLWLKILDSQIETGTPYLLYKDACNIKSNQKNIGTIKSSNLCCEIVEYSDEKETAVCNLASIGLPSFVNNPDTRNISNVKVYGKNNCMYCKISTSLLKNYDINYEYISLDNDDERKQMYNKINSENNTNINSVPIIYVSNTFIGGCKELKQMLAPTYDFDKLHEVTKHVTENLNKVIDINYYPTVKTRLSNMKHRPIGIGVQGLADVFAIMDFPFDSNEAKELNEQIFETIYHAACEKSYELSFNRYSEMKRIITNDSDYKNNDNPIDLNNRVPIDFLLDKYNPVKEELEMKTQNNSFGSYSSFVGSPASKGILQFDLWGCKPSNRYDWDTLKNNIKNYGMRNSLLVAPMPTASTSQILGNNECFEPFTSNIYLRRTLAGEFIVINKHLMKDLIDIDMWDTDIKNSIILHKGSIQQLTNLPKYIRDKYKIVWELPMKSLIDMAHTRGKYICQSQSMNLWMENPTYDKITAMHFYAWSKGLKTGLYYLRTKSKAAAQQFTIEPSQINKYKNISSSDIENSNEPDECLMCSG